MDYRKLHEDILDLVVETLHSYEQMGANPRPQTFAELTESMSGARKHYQLDPVFHAKAQSLAARLIQVVQRNITPT